MPKDAKKNSTGAITVSRPGPKPIESMRQQLATWSVEDLKSELTSLLGLSAENLARLAAIVAELESRGECLKSLRLGILPWLRQIAAGVLLPEIVVKYASQRTAIKHISRMDIDKQRRIALGKEEFELPKKHIVTSKSRHTGNWAPSYSYLENDGPVEKKPELKPIDVDDDDDEEELPVRRSKNCPVPLENLVNVAGSRDVADMIISMIFTHSRPGEVLQHLQNRLRERGCEALIKLA